MTLEEVIIDFGANKELKIKNYIDYGSFYVALTRVRNGSNLFLKSYDRSYIKVRKGLHEKVSAFQKFNSYQLKKIYLDEKIFEDENREFKFGYLNCNGLMDASHAEYINADRNLPQLHLLALAETQLTKDYPDDQIENIMQKWRIVKRYDAPDRKHMGLILLVPRDKYDRVWPQLHTIIECPLWRQNDLQIQGLKVNMRQGLKLGFVYCRATPSISEVEAIKSCFGSCHFLVGDLNLSTGNSEDKRKLELLCSDDKFLALKEVTRLRSGKQIDHIIAMNEFQNNCFCTSYINFCSDHKAIIARMGDEFTQEFLRKTTFSSEKHQKETTQMSETKKTPESEHRSPKKMKMSKHSRMSTVSARSKSPKGNKDKNENNLRDKEFHRRFMNPDSSTCWLNSCLQLLLNGIDQMPYSPHFSSPLGLELLRLKHQTNVLNPINIKKIVMKEERTRVENNPGALFLDLENGQQCVRDFFLALGESLYSWLDVYELYHFKLTEQTICGNPDCKRISSGGIYPHLYLEMEVPTAGSNFSFLVEKELSNSFTVDYHCETRLGGCGSRMQAEHRTIIDSILDKYFLIVVLSRVIFGPNGQPELNNGRVCATGEIEIYDKAGIHGKFHPIAVIEHSGFMRGDGETRGHYTCDVKAKDGSWYKTSDNNEPRKITSNQVSKKASVILYLKK